MEFEPGTHELWLATGMDYLRNLFRALPPVRSKPGEVSYLESRGVV